MKIIFLDFDGVLNSHWYMLENPKEWNKAMAEENQIDPENVAILNKIVKETGAKIVISSSWRLIRTKEQLTTYLQKRGFIGEVIDMTPDGIFQNGIWHGAERGMEIQAWLDSSKEPVESFVILDDNSDMAHLKHKLILTGYLVGLEDIHAIKAIQMLNGK